MDGKIQDAKAIPMLGVKLAGAKGEMRYQVIRLLRHLSGDTMGPKVYSERQEQQDEWTWRWSEWAARR